MDCKLCGQQMKVLFTSEYCDCNDKDFFLERSLLTKPLKYIVYRTSPYHDTALEDKQLTKQTNQYYFELQNARLAGCDEKLAELCYDLMKTPIITPNNYNQISYYWGTAHFGINSNTDGYWVTPSLNLSNFKNWPKA